MVKVLGALVGSGGGVGRAVASGAMASVGAPVAGELTGAAVGKGGRDVHAARTKMTKDKLKIPK
jgi:hypothetical protein